MSRMIHLHQWRGRLAFGLCFAISAFAAHAQRIGPFDFDYRISGHAEARPQQVFDDGIGKTYFQFRPGATVPVILVGAGPEMKLPAVEGPYHVVAGRARDYTLVVPAGTARVRHAAVLSGAQPSSSHPEAAPAVSPLGPATYRTSDRTISSYATPVRGDVIEWTEPDVAAPVNVAFPGKSVHVRARDIDRLAASIRQGGRASQILIEASDRHPASLFARRLASLRRSLTVAGAEPQQFVPAAGDAAVGPLAPTDGKGAGRPLGRDVLRVRWRPAARPSEAATQRLSTTVAALPSPVAGVRVPSEPLAAMGRPVPGQFDLLLSDGTVAVALRRWALHAGYEVHWDTPVHAPVTGELTLDAPSFPDAAERVIAGLRDSGYPLQLKTDSGRTLRVSRLE